MALHMTFTPEDDGPEPVPAGVYQVNIESYEDKPSNSSEYNYYALKLIISDGEYAGRKLFTNLSQSPKAKFKIKEFCRACGEPDELLNSPSGFTFDLDNYIGLDFLVIVKNEPYQDRIQNRVENFRPLSSEVGSPGAGWQAPPATSAAKNQAGRQVPPSQRPKIR